MKRLTLVKIHIFSSITGFLLIVAFFGTSLTAELMADPDLIYLVKRTIFYSLPIMVVTMPVLGLSGNRLAGKSQNPYLLIKKDRMKWIAGNGILLLCLASFLYFRISSVGIDTWFQIAQLLELALGGINLCLMAMNFNAARSIRRSVSK